MAKTETAALTDGLFVPLMQGTRGGGGSHPVGTLQGSVITTGNGTGGTVTLNLTMTAQGFGFRYIYVPTLLALFDDLSSPEAVAVIWAAVTRRLQSDFLLSVLPIATSPGNAGNLEPAGVMLEGVDATPVIGIQAIWSTNTNTKTYRMNVFGMVYDAELLERSGEVTGLLEGLR